MLFLLLTLWLLFFLQCRALTTLFLFSGWFCRVLPSIRPWIHGEEHSDDSGWISWYWCHTGHADQMNALELSKTDLPDQQFWDRTSFWGVLAAGFHPGFGLFSRRGMETSLCFFFCLFCFCFGLHFQHQALYKNFFLWIYL